MKIDAKEQNRNSWAFGDGGIEYEVQIDPTWFLATVYDITAYEHTVEELVEVIFRHKRKVCEFEASDKLIKLVRDSNNWADAHNHTPRDKDHYAIAGMVISELRKRGIN